MAGTTNPTTTRNTWCDGTDEQGAHLVPADTASTVDMAEDGASRSYDMEFCPACYEHLFGEAPDLSFP